jgi:hypothetical protein
MLSSDSGDADSKNCKCGYGGAYVGVGKSLEFGIKLSVFCWCWFERNLTSVVLKMCSYLIYFMKTFYKVCIFNPIWENNAAINHITVQHKKVSFALTSVHTLGSAITSFLMYYVYGNFWYINRLCCHRCTKCSWHLFCNAV